MKVTTIINKMQNHKCSVCNEIHLSDFTHSKKGGVWVSISDKDCEEVLNKIKSGVYNEETSGWKKYLDQWEAEGKITKEDRT